MLFSWVDALLKGSFIARRLGDVDNVIAALALEAVEANSAERIPQCFPHLVDLAADRSIELRDPFRAKRVVLGQTPANRTVALLQQFDEVRRHNNSKRQGAAADQ